MCITGASTVNTVMLSYCHIVILSQYHAVIRSYCQMVILSYCHIVILSGQLGLTDAVSHCELTPCVPVLGVRSICPAVDSSGSTHLRLSQSQYLDAPLCIDCHRRPGQ